MKNFIYICLSLLLISACVSSKKHQDLQSKFDEALEIEERHEKQIDALKAEIDYLQIENQKLRDIARQMQENTLYRGNIQDEEAKLWKEKYEKLQIEFNQVLKNSSQEATILRESMKDNKTSKNYTSSNTENTSENNSLFSNNAHKTFPNKITEPKDVNNNLISNTPIKANPEIQSQLNTLQTEILAMVSSLNTNEFNMQASNNQVDISILDDMLFDMNKKTLTKEGAYILQNIFSVLKKYPNVKTFIETGDHSTNVSKENNIKLQVIRNFLSESNIPYELNLKTNTPLAFETSGTEIQRDKTVFMFKLE